MKKQHAGRAAAMVVGVVVGGAAAALSLTETFTLGNQSDWSWGVPGAFVEPTGGNVTHYYRHPALTGDMPTLASPFNADNAFLGDFRHRRIIEMGLDVKVHSSSGDVAGRHVTVMLVSDNDTPADPSDDWAGVSVNPNAIDPSSGAWARFEFRVYYGDSAWPSGWFPVALGPNAPGNPSWHDLMSYVSQIRYSLGDPTVERGATTWDLGVDNLWLTFGICPADVDFDDVVAFSDLNIVLSNYNQSGFPLEGDTNFDGEVNFEDLNVILGAYNTVCDCGCDDL